MRFMPRVTVATIVESQGRFLLVEEQVNGQTVFNQPAGHLEADESLIQAALRETLEETGWEVELTGLIGLYLYPSRNNGITYQRVCFAAKPRQQRADAVLDEGIIAAHWLTREQVLACRERWRSPMVLRCIDDYLEGVRGPLALIRSS